MEEETLSEYPLQIQSTGFDLTSMMVGNASEMKADDEKDTAKKDDGKVKVMQLVTNMFSTMDSNDLKSLKEYLDEGRSGIEKYTNAVEYSYNVTPQIFKEEKNGVRQVHPDQSFSAMGLGSSSSSNSIMSSMMSTDVFFEMPETGSLYESQYDVKEGRWPEKYNECVLVLSSNGSISDFLAYTLGLRDPLELDEMIQQFMNEETIDIPTDFQDYSYDQIVGTTFKLVNSSDFYEYDSQYKVWKDKTDNASYMKKLVENGETIRIVGVVQPKEGAAASSLNPGICYPASLTRYVAEQAADSEIVKQQLADTGVDVFTNKKFGESEGESSFSEDSLFTVDEAALQNAFRIDESVLAGSGTSLDLSGTFLFGGNGADLSGMMDVGGMDLSMGEMSETDLQNLLKGIKVEVSSDGMQKLSASMLEGYQEYAKTHPEADYSNLQEDFREYLRSESARKILSDNLQEILKSNGEVTVSAEQIQELIRNLMKGYQEFLVKNGYTDPAKIDEYLTEYLQTEEAKKIITDWMEKIYPSDRELEISDAQLEKLTNELLAGYLEYVKGKGLPDPTKIGDHMLEYLNTADGQKRFSEGLVAAVDMDSLEQQLSKAMSSYMEQVMGTMSESVAQALEQQVQQMMGQITKAMESSLQQTMSQFGTNLQNAMGNAISIDADSFANAFQMNLSEEDLAELFLSLGSKQSASYDGNLQKLGYADFSEPSGINIYPKDFQSKEQVVKILDDYNTRMKEVGKEEQVITYTDVVGTLMSSVTDIVDIISYVLIAFVAISLVVSSIMIGVITYISVLERKKEIGILRAIGASKGNISQVFNAETFIIGLCAGLIGIGLTLLLLIPCNAVIHQLADTTAVSAVLPFIPAVVLILLSIGLTLLGGLIPSRKAAKSDPVTALRTE